MIPPAANPKVSFIHQQKAYLKGGEEGEGKREREGIKVRKRGRGREGRTERRRRGRREREGIKVRRRGRERRGGEGRFT